MQETALFQEAVRLHQSGELAAARVAYEQCLASEPDHVPTLVNLGSLCRQLGDIPSAYTCLCHATAIAPQNAAAHYNFGNLCRSTGDLAAAIAAYRASLACESDRAQTAQSAYNLGLTLSETGDGDGAKTAYRQALAASPEYVDAALNLASLLSDQGHLSEASEILETLVRQHPDDARIVNNLAGIYQQTGQIQAALTALRQAMAMQPDLLQPRSNYLTMMQYLPEVSPAKLRSEAEAWGVLAGARAAQLLGTQPARHFTMSTLDQPLRIGYVSADLCAHPVGFFLQEVVAGHDPARAVPILYSNGTLHDYVTERLVTAVQAKGGNFRTVTMLDDRELARLVCADRIEVLVDLSGHTGKSRLAMFALRPAPVQVSWLGYFATTGLSAIDFVLLDQYHAPAGAEAQFTERIICLPHNRFCYVPASFAPAVAPSPFLKNGHVTFGSFNNTAKLNHMVLDAWALILKEVPESRLILKWRTFADVPYCKQIQQFFAERGIAAPRLELRPISAHCELLEQYADIDIALDPFPFSGGHTSCEALWMGVPVITLPQDRVVSRQTWSFLNTIGLPGLAAGDMPGYMQLAVQLAHTPNLLIELRSVMRERMRHSPLCDVAGFTHLLEEAYRLAWHTIRREMTLERTAETLL